MSETAERRWEEQNEAGCRYFSQGEFVQAEQSFLAAIREAMALGSESVSLASSLNNLGQLKYRQHDFSEAEELFRRSLAIRERALGSDHYGVVQSVNNLAMLHYARGELDAAEPLFRRALELGERHLGSDHPDVAISLNNLARLCFRRDDFAGAVPLLTRLLSIKEREGGASNPEVAAILTSLAKVRHAQGDDAAAEPLARRALAIREQAAARDDPALATNLQLLADICAALSQHDEEQVLRAREQAVRAAEPGDAQAPAGHDAAVPRGSHRVDSVGAADVGPAPRLEAAGRTTPARVAPIAFVHGSDPIAPQPVAEPLVPLAPVRDRPQALPREAAPPAAEVPPSGAERAVPRHTAQDEVPRAPLRPAPQRPPVTGPLAQRSPRPRGSTSDRSRTQPPARKSLLPKLLFGTLVLACLLAAGWFAAGRPPLGALLATVTQARAGSPRPAAGTPHTAAGSVP